MSLLPGDARHQGKKVVVAVMLDRDVKGIVRREAKKSED